MKKDKNATNIVASNVNPFIQLFDKYNLEKLSISDQDLKITISAETMHKNQVSATNDMQTYSKYPAYEEQTKSKIKTKQTTAEQETNTEDKSKYTIIKSPIIGTFYRKPSPDSALFVSEGSTVTPDTTICIIEAMKMMNEIKAECSGTVVKVIARDSSPVKQGDELFYIKP